MLFSMLDIPPSRPILPTPLPTDQEIGITPGTIISDPNFNIGAHPGEIYVRKTPPRRYDTQYSKYYTSSQAYQPFYPFIPVRKLQR